MKIQSNKLIFLILTVMVSFSAAADMEEGLKAYKSKNYIAAFDAWVKDAKKGNALAQRNIGLMYQKGEGVLPDMSKARFWLERAANSNFADAQYDLGMFYLSGNFNNMPDENRAAFWLKKAAEQDHELAKARLKEIDPAYEPKEFNFAALPAQSDGLNNQELTESEMASGSLNQNIAQNMKDKNAEDYLYDDEGFVVSQSFDEAVNAQKQQEIAALENSDVNEVLAQAADAESKGVDFDKPFDEIQRDSRFDNSHKIALQHPNTKDGDYFQYQTYDVSKQANVTKKARSKKMEKIAMASKRENQAYMPTENLYEQNINQGNLLVKNRYNKILPIKKEAKEYNEIETAAGPDGAADNNRLVPLPLEENSPAKIMFAKDGYGDEDGNKNISIAHLASYEKKSSYDNAWDIFIEEQPFLADLQSFGKYEYVPGKHKSYYRLYIKGSADKISSACRRVKNQGGYCHIE